MLHAVARKKCTYVALHYGNKITFICQSEVTCGPIKFHKFVCGRGSAPDPAGGAYDAPPDPLVGWGVGHPLPRLHLLRRPRRLDPRAFGARLRSDKFCLKNALL